MNWNKILNIFILIFFVANLGIFGISYFQAEKKYTISAEREEQLREILKNKGLALYTQLPTYYPMKTVTLKKPQADKEKIAKRILNEGLFDRAFGADLDSYSLGEQELRFYKSTRNGEIYYKGKNQKYFPKDFTQKELERVSSILAEDLMLGIPDMEITYLKTYEEYSIIELHEVFKNKILFCNYVSIKVNKDGSIEASAKRYEPLEFSAEKQEIYSVDEILYSFAESIEKNASEMYSITDIDLGYEIGEEKINDSNGETASPYYRIKLHNEFVYYVNAYTNEVRTNQLRTLEKEE